ncbi:YggS family pyridoxal phosphate enzyme [Bacteroidia bacterium]|nr:YggS family pyridoxal phosphate enzyme [Bacteroidia bacterium]
MIAQRLAQIRTLLPAQVQLIAVSKQQAVELIEEAYQQNQRCFAENKVQELATKYDLLPHDIQWHFIGHLQTNKVKYIAPFVSLIHSVDSFKLLQAIDDEAAANQRVIRCLLQFKIAREASKFGLDMDEATGFLTTDTYKKLRHVEICGVMGMATFTNDTTQIRNEFNTLHQYFDILSQQFFKDSPSFKELSMGVSDDYHIAIECGSTMVRLGSSIFGER